MLVTKDKYNGVLQQLEQVTRERDEALKQAGQLTRDFEELQQSLSGSVIVPADQLPGDDKTEELQQEVARLKKDLGEKNSLLEIMQGQNRTLTKQSETLTQDNADLKKTIESLNTSAAVSTSLAVSQTDATVTSTGSLNEFCRENADDTLSCIQRLKDEGF